MSKVIFDKSYDKHNLCDMDKIESVTISGSNFSLMCDTIKALQLQRDELLEALETIIERWDTPLWKDVPHTAECINAARLIVAKSKGE